MDMFNTTFLLVTYIDFVTAPNAAENLSVPNSTTVSLTVNWDAPAEGGLTGYNVTVEGDGKSQTQSLDKDTMTHTFVGLSPGTEHTVSVVTLASGQQSETLNDKYYTRTYYNVQLRITSTELSTMLWLMLLSRRSIAEF